MTVYDFKNFDFDKQLSMFRIQAINFFINLDFLLVAIILLGAMSLFTFIFILVTSKRGNISFDFSANALYFCSALLLAISGLLKWYLTGFDRKLLYEVIAVSGTVFVSMVAIYGVFYSFYKIFNKHEEIISEDIKQDNFEPIIIPTNNSGYFENKNNNSFNQVKKIKTEKITLPKRLDNEIDCDFIFNELNKYKKNNSMEFTSCIDELTKIKKTQKEMSSSQRAEINDVFSSLIKNASSSENN